MLKFLFLTCFMLSYKSYAGLCEMFFKKPTVTKQKQYLTPAKKTENILNRPLTSKERNFLAPDSPYSFYVRNFFQNSWFSNDGMIAFLKAGFSKEDLETLMVELDPKNGPKELYKFMAYVDIMQTRLKQEEPMSISQIEAVQLIADNMDVIRHYQPTNVFDYESFRQAIEKLSSWSQKEFTDLVRGKKSDKITLHKGENADKAWMSYLKNRKQAEKEMGKTLTPEQNSEILWTQLNIQETGLFSFHKFMKRTGLTSEDVRILIDNNILTTKERYKTMIKADIENTETMFGLHRYLTHGGI